MCRMMLAVIALPSGFTSAMIAPSIAIVASISASMPVINLISANTAFLVPITSQARGLMQRA